MKISASDIAKLGIPSLPTDRQGIEYHAKKNNWRHCFEQIGRGRPKKLYEIASLPAEIRAAIMKRQSDELAEKMPKTLPQVRPGTAMSAQALAEAAKLLNEKQRSVADARCAVVAAVLGIIKSRRYAVAGKSRGRRQRFGNRFNSACKGRRCRCFHSVYRNCRSVCFGRTGCRYSGNTN